MRQDVMNHPRFIILEDSTSKKFISLRAEYGKFSVERDEKI